MPQRSIRGYGRGSSHRPHQRRHQSRRQPQKAFIHPSKFVQSARPREEVVYEAQHSFADFAVHHSIKQNITRMGFEKPSPIQDEAIPHGLAGRDIVGIANTGTGKTAAFAIPVLNRLLAQPQSKAIVLAPTRELAHQIEQQCRELSRGSRISTVLLIGGAAMGPQLRDLRNNPRIVIGTPGRVKDHLERRSLRIDQFNMVVLDEVDRMLDMGFIHDIRHILSHIQGNPQSFYFSATLDSRVKGIIESFSNNPAYVSVKSGETSDNVEQNVVPYQTMGDDKINLLEDILRHDDTAKAIIFDDTKRSVEKLSKRLAASGFLADAIHGGKSQAQRLRVLKKFKANEINVLVATDVAARGLDVSDITHVINYSLPQSYDDYVHRIGRAGRAGRIGYALTFIEK